jgi:hypothetical protein
MEELRKNKMRRGLLGFISCLLLLTACSRKIVVTQSYAAHIIRHSNSHFYPKYAGIARCLTGKVVIKIFEDSAKTKKSPVQLETVYDNDGHVKQSSTFMNNELFSEDVYYRSAYHLIDSIVNTDSKGARSKSVFKYETGKYSVISVDPKNTMTSHVFYLNDRFQCVKKAGTWLVLPHLSMITLGAYL